MCPIEIVTSGGSVVFCECSGGCGGVLASRVVAVGEGAAGLGWVSDLTEALVGAGDAG